MNPSSTPPASILTGRHSPPPSITVSSAPRYPINTTALLITTRSSYTPASTTTRSPSPDTSNALWMSLAASAQLS